MRVLDLFSGRGGMSRAFVERGHEVVTVDSDRRFRPTVRADVRGLLIRPGSYYDVVLAGPPCQAFSVASIGRNWSKPYLSNIMTPRSDKALEALELVQATITLIGLLKPRVWVIENPRAALRKIDILADYERCYITQCQYGRRTQKPTDLWGTISLLIANGFEVRTCESGQPCHEAAPRGTRGERDSAVRAEVSYGLSLELCKASERAAQQ